MCGLLVPLLLGSCLQVEIAKLALQARLPRVPCSPDKGRCHGVTPVTLAAESASGQQAELQLLTNLLLRRSHFIQVLAESGFRCRVVQSTSSLSCKGKKSRFALCSPHASADASKRRTPDSDF